MIIGQVIEVAELLDRVYIEVRTNGERVGICVEKEPQALHIQIGDEITWSDKPEAWWSQPGWDREVALKIIGRPGYRLERFCDE